jgi:hypothetical protein
MYLIVYHTGQQVQAFAIDLPATRRGLYIGIYATNNAIFYKEVGYAAATLIDYGCFFYQYRRHNVIFVAVKWIIFEVSAKLPFAHLKNLLYA